MHIAEGILSPPVLLGGAIGTSIFTAIGLKKMSEKKMPKTALLSSTFFVASLIHIPLGPSSVHLVLNGLVGILLGWQAFPALLIALFLQAILFQFGGLTTLGVNTLNMGLPAIFLYLLFKNLIKRKNEILTLISSFLVGFLGVFLSGLMVALSLIFTKEYFLNTAKLIIFTHLPVMIMEGIITMFIIYFIKKIKKELLE